jgi:hypothetical protein
MGRCFAPVRFVRGESEGLKEFHHHAVIYDCIIMDVI